MFLYDVMAAPFSLSQGDVSTKIVRFFASLRFCCHVGIMEQSQIVAKKRTKAVGIHKDGFGR